MNEAGDGPDGFVRVDRQFNVPVFYCQDHVAEANAVRALEERRHQNYEKTERKHEERLERIGNG